MEEWSSIFIAYKGFFMWKKMHMVYVGQNITVDVSPQLKPGNIWGLIYSVQNSEEFHIFTWIWNSLNQ